MPDKDTIEHQVNLIAEQSKTVRRLEQILVSHAIAYEPTEKTEITSVHIDGIFSNKDETGISIAWAARGVGFGNMSIIEFSNGEVLIDTENMGKEFVKEVLCALIDKAENKL
jgi:predicted aconitase